MVMRTGGKLTRAIVYQRASSDEVKQANSLNRQETHLNNFIENHGYDVVETFSEYASAYQGNERPQFQAALDRLASDKSLILLVNDLTRLSRNLDGYGEWKDYLERIRFASMGNQPVEPLTAELLLVVSANESRVLGSRISSGISAKRKREGKDFAWGWSNPKQDHATVLSKAIEKRRQNAKEATRRIAFQAKYFEKMGITSRKKQCEEFEKMGIKTSVGKKVTPHAIRAALRKFDSGK